MNKQTIVRAWKDPAFRARLKAHERESLPDNPSGTPLSELDEAALRVATGGRVGPPQTGCDEAVSTCGIIACTAVCGASS
jgi:mersacidin/lichenicidin family type 2 lantibiotic